MKIRTVILKSAVSSSSNEEVQFHLVSTSNCECSFPVKLSPGPLWNFDSKSLSAVSRWNFHLVSFRNENAVSPSQPLYLEQKMTDKIFTFVFLMPSVRSKIKFSEIEWKNVFSHRAQLGKHLRYLFPHCICKPNGIRRNKKSRSKLFRGQKRKIEFRKFSKRNPKHLSKYQIQNLTSNRYQPHGACLNAKLFSE